MNAQHGVVEASCHELYTRPHTGNGWRQRWELSCQLVLAFAAARPVADSLAASACHYGRHRWPGGAWRPATATTPSLVPPASAHRHVEQRLLQGRWRALIWPGKWERRGLGAARTGCRGRYTGCSGGIGGYCLLALRATAQLGSNSRSVNARSPAGAATACQPAGRTQLAGAWRTSTRHARA